MDSDPLLALTGQVPTEFVGNDAFQETDTTGVTTPITKDNTFASDSDRVGSDVSETFALAGAGRPGPTLVDLPKDVTNGETDCEPDAPAVPDTYRVQKRADPEIVAAAAERIENADRPAMLLGGGVIKGEASEACRGSPSNTRSGHHHDARHRAFPEDPRTLPRDGGHARHRLRQHGDHSL